MTIFINLYIRPIDSVAFVIFSKNVVPFVALLPLQAFWPATREP